MWHPLAWRCSKPKLLCSVWRATAALTKAETVPLTPVQGCLNLTQEQQEALVWRRNILRRTQGPLIRRRLALTAELHGWACRLLTLALYCCVTVNQPAS